MNWLVVLVCALMAGCSASHERETAPVSGTVTLDGVELTEGAILFLPPQGRASTGIIQPNGTYVMSTYGDGDGATVGNHRIYVRATASKSESDQEFEAVKVVKKSNIPLRYQSVKTSGLTFEVKAGQSNVFPIILTSK